MEKKIIKGIELADKEFEIQEDGSLRIVEIKTKKGKFIPLIGDEFYFINSFGRVEEWEFFDKEINTQKLLYKAILWIIKHQKVFRTRRECEEYKKFIELLDQFTFTPDWGDVNQEKYNLYYNHRTKEFISQSSLYTQAEQYYFPSKTKVDKFVTTAGEENIKKFMFDILD